ncbi:hypothetical protein SH668x_000704 [Planctomicrobium sp. SH668]|uniref:hypothetical protein n=1 Tax=Planctomicrobium sp. SH668 TaxID=3448126 RepID=UPI003F5B9836
MQLTQHLVPYLLLFQLLFPALAAAIVFLLLQRCPKVAARLSVVVYGLLALTGLVLLREAQLLPALEDFDNAITIEWQLRSPQPGHQWADRISWRLTSDSALLIAVLPWVGVTTQLFSRSPVNTSQRTSLNLLIASLVSLFIVGDDFGTLLSSGFFTAILISLSVATSGIQHRRRSANVFLVMQVIGLILMGASLAMFSSSASMIQSVPVAAPGETKATIFELASRIQTAFQLHPAATELWGEYRELPSLIWILGLAIASGCFPFHLWFSEVNASSHLQDRIWILVWSKVLLFVGVSTLMELDPEAVKNFGNWALYITVSGASFVALMMFSHAQLPEILSNTVIWTQQITLISVIAIPDAIGALLSGLVIGEIASLILLSVTVSTITERFRSTELVRYQGLNAIAPWLPPTLLLCCLTLTLTPGVTGFAQAWSAMISLEGIGTSGGAALRWVVLISNLLAVAGLLRLFRQLGSGDLHLPEHPQPLREQLQSSDAKASLCFTAFQYSLFIFWAGIALAFAFIIPAQVLFSE